MKPTFRILHYFDPLKKILCITPLLFCLGLTSPGWAAAPFIVNDNGTVTDSSTALVWDQCTYGLSGSTCNAGTVFTGTWQQALVAAVAANAAGYKGFSDWRVPNRNELESITKIGSSPAIDIEAFPNTTLYVYYFWTSTTYGQDSGSARVVTFNNGNVYFYGKHVAGVVRLVRSGQSLAPFDLLGSPPDTTPPVTTAGPAVTSGPTQSTAGLSVTIDEAGTGYWLLVPSAAAAPTPAQVVAGANYGAVTVVASGNIPISAATPAGISLTGLTAGTDYKLYFVAKDTANNLQAAVSSAAFTTIPVADTTPPVTTAAPTLISGTSTTASISVTINETGTGYWLLVPRAAPAPTPAQVMVGGNYGTVTVFASGNLPMSAGTPAGINLTGLTPGAQYQLYFVGRDTSGNLQAAVSGPLDIPALAVVTATSIPTLSEWGAILLSGLLGLLGLARARRQNG